MTVNLVAGRPPIASDNQQITWSPIADPTILPFTGTSYDKVKNALSEVFGPYPIRLAGGNHVLVLQGMMAAAGEGREPFRVLLTALTKFGALEVNLA